MAIGMMGDFNMWNYEMVDETELNRFTCRAEGNVSSSKTLTYLGDQNTLKYTYISVPECNNN